MTPILGIDYGHKHVGLALATTLIAEPLQTVPTHQTITRIQELIKLHGIQTIVIGLSENTMAQTTAEFGHTLSVLTKLPIYYQDETLSSRETRIELARTGAKKTKREHKIDHLVAARILQDFLDSHPEVDMR